ncbi:hypothetical protein PENSPDRAFT_700616, partial [Peniophora sp. CONT]
QSANAGVRVRKRDINLLCADATQSARVHFLLPLPLHIFVLVPMYDQALSPDTQGRRRDGFSAPVVAIQTLHDDVLCEIFYSAASLEPPASLTNEAYQPRHLYTAHICHLSDHLGWMRLTHVCQRWRNILLGTGMSRLWGRVAFTYPPITAFPTLFSRSRNALLDTFLRTPSASGQLVSFHSERMRAAADNLARTRSLQVRGSVSADLLGFFADPALSLPYLEELVLKFDYGSPIQLHDIMHGLAPPDETVGDALSLGNIWINGPNARSASVELVRLKSGVAVFHRLHLSLPSLRHLEVRIYDDSTQISNLQWLISLIRTSPLLETLSLDLTIENYTPDWDALFAGPPAPLPHLKQLIIKDCRSIDLAPFTAQVCIDPPAYIFASCGFIFERAAVTASNAPQRTISFIHNFGCYLCRPGHVALHISVALSGGPPLSRIVAVGLQSMPLLKESIILDTSSPHLGQFVWHPQEERRVLGPLPDSVEISFRFLSTSSVCNAWIEALSSRIPNKELVEQLDLRVPHLMSRDWMSMLRHYLLLPMSALHLLYILEHLYASASVVAWVETIDILRPSHTILFPALHTLVVAFFAKPLGNDNPQDPLEAWWCPLIEVLTERHAYGSPIHTLRIVGTWARDFKEYRKDRDAQLIARVVEVVDNVVDERVEKEPLRAGI